MSAKFPRLSVLNFFSSAVDIVAQAQLCEALGCFHRFWIGEHHGGGQVADALTVAMLAAGVTERIRLGTGAVSLTFRSPLSVSEGAVLAASFFPDRIDLGVTRGVAVAPEAQALLAAHTDIGAVQRDYEQRLELLASLMTRAHPLSPRANGYTDEEYEHPAPPPLYVMGTSVERAVHAARLGAGFVASFHHGISVERARASLRAYRNHFVPRGLLDEPESLVVISGHVATTLDELDNLKRIIAAFPPDAARAAEALVTVWGLSDYVAREVLSLAEEVGADEMMFLPVVERPEKCIDNLAEGWKAAALAFEQREAERAPVVREVERQAHAAGEALEQ